MRRIPFFLISYLRFVKFHPAEFFCRDRTPVASLLPRHGYTRAKQGDILQRAGIRLDQGRSIWSRAHKNQPLHGAIRSSGDSYFGNPCPRVLSVELVRRLFLGCSFVQSLPGFLWWDDVETGRASKALTVRVRHFYRGFGPLQIFQGHLEYYRGMRNRNEAAISRHGLLCWLDVRRNASWNRAGPLQAKQRQGTGAR